MGVWDGESSGGTAFPSAYVDTYIDGIPIGPGRDVVVAEDSNQISVLFLVDTSGPQGTSAPQLSQLEQTAGPYVGPIRVAVPFNYTSQGVPGAGFFGIMQNGGFRAAVFWDGDVSRPPVRIDEVEGVPSNHNGIMSLPLRRPAPLALAQSGDCQAVALAYIRPLPAI